MKIILTESQLGILKKSIKSEKIQCEKCGWGWDLSDGGDDSFTCHKCGHVNKEEEIDERSRSFAFTRKKRLFSKPERLSNPLRFKVTDRLEENDEIRLGSLTDKQVKSIDDLNKDAKFLKCKACKKLYTQTTHKKKKSLPICPWCGKHN
jgi:transcription initiation factor TFIIIB Brf1 subunit/transcription initiation factor TFIIB